MKAITIEIEASANIEASINSKLSELDGYVKNNIVSVSTVVYHDKLLIVVYYKPLS